MRALCRFARTVRFQLCSSASGPPFRVLPGCALRAQLCSRPPLTALPLPATSFAASPLWQLSSSSSSTPSVARLPVASLAPTQSFLRGYTRQAPVRSRALPGTFGTIISELTQLVKKKDAQLEQSEAKYRKLLADNTSDLKNNTSLVFDLTKELQKVVRDYADARTLLKEVQDANLELTNRRNLRGALEYAAELTAPKLSTQLALSKLKDDPKFDAIVDILVERHHLRKEEVLECLGHVYHTVSKAHRACVQGVHLRYKDLPAPAERAAVAAAFERWSIRYTYIDEKGDSVFPSPFAC